MNDCFAHHFVFAFHIWCVFYLAFAGVSTQLAECLAQEIQAEKDMEVRVIIYPSIWKHRLGLPFLDANLRHELPVLREWP